MAKEIERKYLVKPGSWKGNLTEADSSFIQQGYLSTDPDRVVRIRIRDKKAFLTIKNRPEGLSRNEFEYSIPVEDAVELMKMCVTAVIVKRRYEIRYKNHRWEVDEFLGKNKGLVLAEIELKNETDDFPLPDWIGEEVSDNPKYSNLQLAIDQV